MPGQHPLIHVGVGLAQQRLDHSLGLVGALDAHLRDLQGLSTADHHVAAAQGDQVGFQLFQFLGTGTDPRVELGQFIAVPADVGIFCSDLAAESIALLFELAALLLKRR